MSDPTAPPPAYGSANGEAAVENDQFQQGPTPTSYSNAGYTTSADSVNNQATYPPKHQQPEQPNPHNYPPAYSAQPPYPQGQQAQYPPAQYPPTSQYPPVQSQYPPPTSNYTPSLSQPLQQQNVWSGSTSQPQPERPPPTEAAQEWEQNMQDFAEKSVRLGFIKKVFALLSVMLVVTFGIMSLFMFVEEIRYYAQQHSWLYITAVIVYMATAIALVCAGDMRRKFPQNIICLAIITLAMGVMLGCIAASFEVQEIMIAVGITLLVTIAMMLLGFQKKFDFTWMSGILVVCCIGLIGFGLMAAIFQSEILQIFYASLGAILFSLFIVVDVQLMLGGKHKCAISPEEYILAALNLYLDIINLFLFILMLVGKK